MDLRRQFLCVLLFFAVVIADAWLLQSFYDYERGRADVSLDAVKNDMVYFPVPESSYDTKRYNVSFADSWMESRNFGGERGHEGCDIMAAVNERGH